MVGQCGEPDAFQGPWPVPSAAPPGAAACVVSSERTSEPELVAFLVASRPLAWECAGLSFLPQHPQTERGRAKVVVQARSFLVVFREEGGEGRAGRASREPGALARARVN